MLFPILNYFTCNRSDTKQPDCNKCENQEEHDAAMTSQSARDDEHGHAMKIKKQTILPGADLSNSLKSVADVAKALLAHEKFKSKMKQPEFVRDKIHIENQTLNSIIASYG